MVSGIVAGHAYDPDRDRNLKVISVGHLFGNNVTHLGVKQGAYLRSFVYTFIELFSPTLTKKINSNIINNKTFVISTINAYDGWFKLA